MAKAETGVAGPVVAELAYRNEYIAVRGQTKLAEEAWRRNKCQETSRPRGARRRRRRHPCRRAGVKGVPLAVEIRQRGVLAHRAQHLP